MRLLQDPNQNNVDKIKDLRLQTNCSYFKNKKKEYPKLELMNLHLTKKNIRDFYRGV